jgi:hypothetical protein
MRPLDPTSAPVGALRDYPRSAAGDVAPAVLITEDWRADLGA